MISKILRRFGFITENSLTPREKEFLQQFKGCVDYVASEFRNCKIQKGKIVFRSEDGFKIYQSLIIDNIKVVFAGVFFSDYIYCTVYGKYKDIIIPTYYSHKWCNDFFDEIKKEIEIDKK